MLIVGTVFAVTLFLTVNFIVVLMDGGRGGGADLEMAIKSIFIFYLFWSAVHVGYALCYNGIALLTGGFTFEVSFVSEITENHTGEEVEQYVKSAAVEVVDCQEESAEIDEEV